MHDAAIKTIAPPTRKLRPRPAQIRWFSDRRQSLRLATLVASRSRLQPSGKIAAAASGKLIAYSSTPCIATRRRLNRQALPAPAARTSALVNSVCATWESIGVDVKRRCASCRIGIVPAWKFSFLPTRLCLILVADAQLFAGMPSKPDVRAKIRRALRAGAKPLDIARKLRVPLLTIAAFVAEQHERLSQASWH